MSELLEAFIEFFAGVAAPPPAPASDAAAVAMAVAAADGGSAAVVARAAAVEAVEMGAALPAPSPNLVFAALQVSLRGEGEMGGGMRGV